MELPDQHRRSMTYVPADLNRLILAMREGNVSAQFPLKKSRKGSFEIWPSSLPAVSLPLGLDLLRQIRAARFIEASPASLFVSLAPGGEIDPIGALQNGLGFRHAGLLEGSGYKHGRWLDTVFMQLPLNGGTASPPDPQSLPERNFAEGK